jgi:hypothetical protein
MARRWSWGQYFALIGVPLLIWNVWTEVAWLIDGPRPVTQFRDTSSVNWYATHVLECVMILGALAVIVYLIRGCRRERRFLTFEVMFCLAGATLHWANFGINFFQPIIMASSNFVNLNASCGHMPFIINPDCGRAADPVLFFFLMGAFMIPGEVFLATWLLHRVTGRWPGLPVSRVWMMIGGLAVMVAFLEIPILLLGFYAYGGPRWMSLTFGPGAQYNVVILFQSAVCTVAMIAFYYFRNDKGERFIERGLDHYTPRRQRVLTLLAVYVCVQLATWVPGTMPVAFVSFYQDGWPKLPAYLVNDMCDAPGVTGTRYGPCPGSPGFRMPVRHSLPGESP